MTYRAKPVTQRDGSKLQNSNCLMATAATGLDYHTLGEKVSTGSHMRQLSGDLSGGTNSDEIEKAWKRGYAEDPVTRDGQPWSKVAEDLAAGRLVMLQVWAATVGSPLCCTSAVGHGIAVAPETRVTDGRREYLVADPWCRPAKWVWVREDKLKAGAEKWARQMGAGALDCGVKPPAPGSEPSAAWLNFTHAFWEFYGDPTAPADVEPSDDGAMGPGDGVLFASTKPHPEEEEGTDVAINTNGSDIQSKRRVDLTADAGFYAEATLDTKYGTLDKGRSCIVIGPALGTTAMAILVNTSKPYSDGQKRWTVVYVTKDKCGDTYTVETPPADDDARDKAWRSWLDSDPNAPDRT